MWNLSVPWWEFVLRGVVVYLFLLVFLRLTGKRQTGQYAPFDLVLLLILSNAVQNSMNAGDNSLIGGLISASTLISCHVALSHFTYRFRRLERLIDGRARVLVVTPGPVRTNVSRNALAADGSARGVSDAAIDNGIDPQKVSELIWQAVAMGTRELLIAEGMEAGIPALRAQDPERLFDTLEAMVAQGYAQKMATPTNR